VPTNKLVSKFIEIGRVNVIMTRLRSALQRPKTLSITERKKLSNELLFCYVQQLLSEKDAAFNQDDFSSDNEIDKMIQSNEDYDTYVALGLFRKHGLMSWFLKVRTSKADAVR
jgi:hypothetical protein